MSTPQVFVSHASKAKARFGKPRTFVDFMLNLPESYNRIKVLKPLGATPMYGIL
jgi:hypothetical protein